MRAVLLRPSAVSDSGSADLHAGQTTPARGQGVLREVFTITAAKEPPRQALVRCVAGEIFECGPFELRGSLGHFRRRQWVE